MNLLGMVFFFLATVFASKSYSEGSCNYSLEKSKAIQDIEYLRKRYAKATDKIGTGVKQSVEEGRRTYQRIFSKDAVIWAGEHISPQIGPEAWVQVVAGALKDIGPTQHLIGTQLVELKRFELDEECNLLRGTATMESYVQAWHERKDDLVWVFIGTYLDEVGFLPGLGWRIEAMQLLQVGGETRFMGSAVAGPN
jgi:hypothetical protein